LDVQPPSRKFVFYYTKNLFKRNINCFNFNLVFFIGTLLDQTSSSIFHRAEEIKLGTMGSEDEVTSDNSYNFSNIYVTNQVSVGIKLKIEDA